MKSYIHGALGKGYYTLKSQFYLDTKTDAVVSLKEDPGVGKALYHSFRYFLVTPRVDLLQQSCCEQISGL